MTKPTKASKASKSVKSVKSAKASKPAKALKPSAKKASKAVKPTKASKAPKPAKLVKPAKVAKAVTPAKEAKIAKPAKQVKPEPAPKSSKNAKPAKQAEQERPSQPPKALKPAPSKEEKPAKAPKREAQPEAEPAPKSEKPAKAAKASKPAKGLKEAPPAKISKAEKSSKSSKNGEEQPPASTVPPLRKGKNVRDDDEPARPLRPREDDEPRSRSGEEGRRAIPRDEPRLPKLGKLRPITTPAPPPPPPPAPKSLEERIAEVVVRLEAQTEEFRRLYRDRFDMSWIFHDSALEGTSYSPEELRAAIDTTAQLPPDSSLQQVVDEIRRNRDAIDFCRDLAQKKRIPITVDTVKQIHWKLHPEEPDFRTVKFRKDIPQHRLYFHEYAAPDKIPGKVRAVIDWLNDPETRKVRNGVRIAARAHYDLLRVFPFAEDSGKVARMLMNVLLMRSGYPPAIIHHTERQRYYEALKGSPAVVLAMVQESIDNAVASIEKLLDDHDAKKRNYGTV
ncbi:MAG: Fic family protein [Polyangiaceae bacterium]